MNFNIYNHDKEIIQNIVKKSIYNLIKEGTIYDEVDNMWSYLENTLGTEKMLDELYHYLDSDTIEDFINHIKRYYEIDEI